MTGARKEREIGEIASRAFSFLFSLPAPAMQANDEGNADDNDNFTNASGDADGNAINDNYNANQVTRA